MAKIMRAFLPFAVALLASGENQGVCVLNGMSAVDELLDSAVYIWAALERCHEGDVVRCEVNIASTIESLTGMINVILKAVHQCGGLEGSKCGLAAGELTETFSGLAAASGGIAAKCGANPVQTVRGHMQDVGRFHNSKFGTCTVDIKASMKALFNVIARLMTVKHNCEDAESHHCIHNDLKVVASFASLAEYVSGAVGRCTEATGGGFNGDAYCTGQVAKMVKQLSDVGKASTYMSRDCHEESDARLYLLDAEEEGTTKKDSSSVVTGALVALLPITAVLSFVGGSRLAKARTNVHPQDVEALIQDE